MRAPTARNAIRDCVYNAARGVDRHDVDLILAAYHDDAVDDHGYFVGTANDFAHRAVISHDAWPSHMHYIMNHLVWFDPQDSTRATAETYFIMVGRRPTHEIDCFGGRYLDNFEDRAGRWAIASRLCTIEWSRNGEAMPELLSHFVSGRQDCADPSYAIATMDQRTHRDIRPFARK